MKKKIISMPLNTYVLNAFNSLDEDHILMDA